ncbi:MAG TPA: hypothetical protein DGG95_13850, partial [Cytophagales bacterium]|nr:hypothetical protein [Cytophagales bacterium]
TTVIRIGTDLLDLIKTGTGNSFKGWELNGDIDLSKYYLTADIGSWGKNVQLANGDYANSGSYFRIGADVNLLGNDPDKNMFFFGFRIGHSLFHETLSYQATSVNLYPPSTYAVSNSSVTGSWGELTTGLRVKIWKGLWMGYTARMKFSPKTKGSNDTMAPYDMPGYGIVSQKPWWGFNYQMFWRFAWKKDKPAPKKN